MKAAFVFLASFLFILSAPNVSAHPGDTDSNGGHYCRTNCNEWGYIYGEYHYRNSDYFEPDYYEQGFTFGSDKAIEDNLDNLTSNAESEGKIAGHEDGIIGEEEQTLLSAPVELCDIEFRFRADEYQEFIEGSYDGWGEVCPEIVNDAYQVAYTAAYQPAYAEYVVAQQDDDLSVDIIPPPVVNTTSSTESSNWPDGFTIASVASPFLLVALYSGITYWRKRRSR